MKKTKIYDKILGVGNYLTFWDDLSGLAANLNVVAILLVFAGLSLCIVEIFEPCNCILYGLGAMLCIAGIALQTAICPTIGSLFIMLYFCAAVIICGYLAMLLFYRRGWLAREPITENAEESVKPRDFYFLLNQEGIAANNLAPFGKVVINDELFEVECVGTYVEHGGKVKVVEVEGTKIIVKGK